MSSPAEITDEVVTAYEGLKLGEKYTYLICKVSDDYKSIVLEKAEKTAGTTADFDAFAKALTGGRARYAVYRYSHQTEDGEERHRIVFIVWAPDSNVRDQMAYTASKDSLRKKLPGIGMEIQATEPSELSRKEVDARLLMR